MTRLEIQPDMSGVTVESTLWVREGQRWLVFGSRNATVRPDDLGREAGKNLAEDPQVKGAFQIVEMLGLGAVPAEVKERSLRIGAATEKALGMARSAFNQDLDHLALPVLEPDRDARPNNEVANPRSAGTSVNDQTRKSPLVLKLVRTESFRDRADRPSLPRADREIDVAGINTLEPLGGRLLAAKYRATLRQVITGRLDFHVSIRIGRGHDDQDRIARMFRPGF